ncbi:MAG: hypothetical protein PHT59_04450 [Candidatus Omnitrophica bacterium]|nr:hypothetical protein [Candidatus Omnitrophota bacterium]
MKATLTKAVCALLVVGMATICYAQVSTPSIPVRASIGNQTGITANITRITPGTPVIAEPASEINFGTLYLDPVYHIFRSVWYFFMDVGVNTNANNWTVTHYANPVSGAGTNLDSHINVSFVRQLTNTTEAALTGGKVSYAASDGRAYSKNSFPTGWLRIYYGIGTGNNTTDNSGVTPIPQTQPAADYSGSVYLTLTTQ